MRYYDNDTNSNIQKYKEDSQKVRSTKSHIIRYSFFLFFLIFLSFSINSSSAPTTNNLTSIKKINSTQLLQQLNQKQGNYVLINFFASWCPPCKEEVPHFLAIQEKFPQIEVVGLSLDEDVLSLEAFIYETAITYPVFLPSDEVLFAYRTNSIPYSVIYDKNLKIIYAASGILTEDKMLTLLIEEENKANTSEEPDDSPDDSNRFYHAENIELVSN